MPALITTELVDLDVPSADRRTAVAALARRLADAGRVTDLDRFLADVEAREVRMPTGLEGGIGIPHCRSATVTTASLAFGRSASGIDFGAEDGPADLVFLLAVPAEGDPDHLGVLAALARRLVRASFTSTLREATAPAAAATFIEEQMTS
ncbi:PTS sugar transporter subunit IIA [Pseudonocardia sp. HH130630-07]|uniref:PTS sugar transporter subunit IIA n=1 Tax=Pseudonocardia sp. HH130630-07 TaxID=1690815 RepID=UPI0008153D01|nr:PTS sugar transporter subunit IIA [Pseudonocardia sp. HH130630-07]ANY10019.1 PTS fructose transporter subunit IIA [Pseudonocardia sp. HH130630-07]